MSAPPPPLPALPRHAQRGMSRGAKVALAVGVPLLLIAFAGLIIAFVAMVFGMMKNTEPYRHAVAVARTDARVQAALGTPIHEGTFVTGSVSTSNAGGSAQLAIPLDGPRGKAKLFVNAQRVEGVWRYRTLRADLPSGPIDLETPP